jgi:hypothetical protein
MKAPVKKRTATKPAAKRSTAKRAATAAQPRMQPTSEKSVQIKKITNGYIVRTSGMVGTGPNAKYVETEVYSKTEPKVVM